jgi:hypothetical protein
MVFQELLCRRVRAGAMSALRESVKLLTRRPNRQSYELTGTTGTGNENFWFSISRYGNVNTSVAMEYTVHFKARIGGV